MKKRANHTKLWKKVFAISVAGCLVMGTVLSGCGQDETQQGSSAGGEKVENTDIDFSQYTTPGVNVNLVGEYKEKELDPSWSQDSSTMIDLSGDSAIISGENAEFAKLENGELTQQLTIAKEGTYVLTGDGENIQVVVDAGEEAKVQLVLNDVSLTNDATAPINIISADKVYITLEEESENLIQDTRAAYVEDETEANATSEDALIEGAIYSEVDLVFNGAGKLTVEAGYDDAIRTKDDLKLISGTYHITSQDDAFVGKDSISIRDGNYTTVAKGAAFKSNQEEDLEKGFVVVDGGTFDLIATEGDGFHGEFVLVINDGNILIRESEEGLEAMNIIINGGNIELFATDDGVNISEAENYSTTFGAETTAAEEMKRPEGFDPSAMMQEDTAIDHIPGALIITGGTLKVTAQGDGLDSNGDIVIVGGSTVVCGPTDSGNGTLDYADDFVMTGGLIAISGNQGMEQNIVSQNIPVLTVNLGTQQEAGTEVVIADENGKEMFGFTGKQAFSYVSFASADLVKDSTYTVTVGDKTVEGTAAISQFGGMGQGGMGPGGQKPGGDGGQKPGGDGGQMPEGFDPSQMPEGNRGQMPNGEVPTMPNDSNEDTTEI